MKKGTSKDPSDRLLMISSDGQATAQMDDYRPYIAEKHHEEFDAFCNEFHEKGSRSMDPMSMLTKLDPEVVEVWQAEVLDKGRFDGVSDINRRFEVMADAGIAAEVIFPDFGLPFEMYNPVLLAITRGYRRTKEQIEIGNYAYNRWLADFCAQAPERFAGMAVVSFEDVDSAVAEIRWAKEHGLRGVLLPAFSETQPIFHPRYDPIWSTVVELDMRLNSHIGMSSTAEFVPSLPPLPHPSIGQPIFSAPLVFFCHQILNQLIWGGVLERHPSLQVVFTEQGSGWVIQALEQMDYSWDGSYLRRDTHEVVKQKPSEYFRRQCHMGSSLFTRAEAEARESIGVDKITIGLDYPHHEGTWGGQGQRHIDFLQATLGFAGVPADEIRLMVGENALNLWGFDPVALRAVANATGPSIDEVMTVPEVDLFPRGDVHKPLVPVG